MADLFTLAELASYLQVPTVDNASATIARNAAQGAVRRFARQNFDQRTYTGAVVPLESAARGFRAYLPQRPVTAVASVAISSWSGGASVALTNGQTYGWDGYSPWIAVSPWRLWSPIVQGLTRTASVTYTAGYATIPDEVKGVALAVAGRYYSNPEGLRSESIDDYSKTRAGADSDLAGVSLLAGERAILNDYRIRIGSVRIR